MIVKFEFEPTRIKALEKLWGMPQNYISDTVGYFNKYESEGWYPINTIEAMGCYCKKPFSYEMTRDYGYAIDSESVRKHLRKYADVPEKYAVEVGLLGMENERYYKFGTFIDSDGNDTDCDFWEIPGCKELEKKAEHKGFWISFTVYSITEQEDVLESKLEYVRILTGINRTVDFPNDFPAYMSYGGDGVGIVRTALSIRLDDEFDHAEVLWCDEHCDTVWEPLCKIKDDEKSSEFIDAIISYLETELDKK